MIEDLNQRLRERGLSLKINKKIKEFLVEKGYDPKFGARPLRRTIEEYIEDPLSEDVLRGKFGLGASIKAELKKETVVFSGTKGQRKKLPKKADALSH